MFQREVALYEFLLNYGRKLTEDLSPQQYYEQPSQGLNHPAWVLGHLSFVAQFGVSLCGGETWLDESWNDNFGVGSTPQNTPEPYPSVAELLEGYEDGHARLTQAVQQADPTLLQKETEIETLRAVFPTQDLLVAHILTSHEATHLG
ncbi:MAG: DinB family protein, partial [Planctomycetota bacterium]|nr:DinB family protein [Planctomycetota bacterium]